MTPTSNPDVVEVAAIASGKVVHRDTIDASGRTQRISQDGCTGTQLARWSSDGRRVFLESNTSCDGAVTRSTAVLTMTPFGEWLDVRSVAAAGRTVVNVARYRDVGFNADVPTEVASAIREYGPNIDAARLASGVPISADAVIEASKTVDVTVLQAWVAQSGLDFVTDAQSLQQLADAGIPAEVTDAMVTVEANSRDVYDMWAGNTFGPQASDYWDQGTGMRVIFTRWPNDPWGYGFGLWRYGHEYTRYVFGSSSWTYGYSPFLWGMGYNSRSVGSMLPPTIVLHNDQTGTASRSRAGSADKADDPKPKDSVLDKAVRAITGAASSAKQGGNTKPSPR